MIFISHNYKDKTIIEPIALKLAEIFGQENVFYDSWSMQPGDGIIDRMNDGLERCTHFFFFVSDNSLKSNMVKMEWQNAIYKSSKGNCKVVPVKLDKSSMPAILSQSLYIDLYINGIDAAIGQIVNVVQGNSTFNANTQTFSNLSFLVTDQTETDLIIKIYASHFFEPIPKFLILFDNNENELSFSIPGQSFYISGFHKGVKLNSGKMVNAQFIQNPSGITPSIPMTIHVKKDKDNVFSFLGVLHQTGEDDYTQIPQKA